MSGRVDPFAILKDPLNFTTKPKKDRPVEKAAIDQVAEQNNFPSRQPPKPAKAERQKPRRYRTGRNQHLGIKATGETLDRFHKAVDARNAPMGEFVEFALDALDRWRYRVGEV